MAIEKKIKTLAKLGEILRNKSQLPDFEKIFISNPWFTKEFVEFSLQQWADLLTEDNLFSWLNNYNFENLKKKNVAIIAAGNIPAVGFHDLICNYIVGHNTIIKLSSKDTVLMKYLIDLMKKIDDDFEINISEERLTNFNAVIASGSQNSNLYFDYYFHNYPHIFRNNRSSLAIISKDDDINSFDLLADDVFTYFGLGCRNISKIFIPKDFNFDLLGNAFQKYNLLSDHYKYYNNICYQYAVLAMNRIVHANFGNLLLTENKDLFSPIAVLNYEYYSDRTEIENYISENKNNIQCVVSNNFIPNTIKFGDAQKPKLFNYADNIDTIDFLLNI